jgi:hypothetical protein
MATFRNVGTIHHFETMMVEAWWRAATRATSPSAASSRSRASANTAFPKATPQLLRQAGLCLVLAEVPPPGGFACALLNSQPMGFYAPAQIVRDAREHGVEVRAVDVNFSDWDNTLERFPSIEDVARRAALAARCARWPMPMPSARSGSTGARRCGRCGACRTMIRCRCLPLRMRASWARSRCRLPAMPLGEHVAPITRRCGCR